MTILHMGMSVKKTFSDSVVVLLGICLATFPLQLTKIIIQKKGFYFSFKKTLIRCKSQKNHPKTQSHRYNPETPDPHNVPDTRALVRRKQPSVSDTLPRYTLT